MKAISVLALSQTVMREYGRGAVNCQAASPKVRFTNRTWPAMSPFRKPPHLSLANHVHCFVSLDRVDRSFDGAEALIGTIRFLRKRWSSSIHTIHAARW